MSFDPYYEWLGIPPDEQPADHYRLLGVRRFERNPVVIENAAERHLLLLKTMQSGPRGQYTQQLMNEVSAARICLLDLHKKAAYDAQLQPAVTSRKTHELRLEPADADRTTQELLGPADADGQLDQFTVEPAETDLKAYEFRLEPTDAARKAHELRLEPEDVDSTTQELLGPADADHKVDQTPPPRRVVNRWTVSGPLPPEQRPATEALPVLEPLPSEDLSAVDPSSRRRRVAHVSKLPRKPGLSKIPRSTQRKLPGGSALVIFGGIAVGVYIGATLILAWFYGGSGRSHPTDEGPREDDSAAVSTDTGLDRDGQAPAP